MRNPFGLLGSGLRQAGGLLGRGLAAAGQNFDRNATGGIDEIMGTDFSPGMRRLLRSNAAMAIGSMLQGKQSLAEGLQSGQNRALSLWQAGRQMKQEQAARDAMAKFGSQMPQERSEGAGGSPSTPDTSPLPSGQAGARRQRMLQLQSRSEYYQREAEKHRQQARGLMQFDPKTAMSWAERGDKLEEQAQKYADQANQFLPKVFKQEEGRDPRTGKPVIFTTFDDGSTEVTAIQPKQNLIAVQRGGKTTLVDPAAEKPGDLEHTISKDTEARVGEDRRQFGEMLPLYQKDRSIAQTRAATDQGMLGVALRNAATHEGQLQVARDAEKRQTNEGMRKVSEAAIDKISQLRMGFHTLNELGNAMEKSGWNGPISGLSTAPGIGRAAQALGIVDPASLQAIIDDARQTIGKAKEGGVLRKEDEEKYKKILPNMDDSAAVAANKIRHLRAMLRKDVEIFADTQRKLGRNIPPEVYADMFTGAPAAPAPSGQTEIFPGIKGVRNKGGIIHAGI